MPRLLIAARVDCATSELHAYRTRLCDLLHRSTASGEIDESTSVLAERFIFRSYTSPSVSHPPSEIDGGLTLDETLHLLITRLDRLCSAVLTTDQVQYWQLAAEYLIWCDLVRSVCAVVISFVLQHFGSSVCGGSRSERIRLFLSVNPLLARTHRDYLLREVRLHVRIFFVLLFLL